MLTLSIILSDIATPIYSQESELANACHTEIATCWNSGTFDSFRGVGDIEIAYAIFPHTQGAPFIIVSPGRIETYLKYKELTFDLVNQGFNVAIIDHRGQGLSGRMLSNPHKGYVTHFDDYARDLNQFIETIVKPFAPDKMHLLGHSMGGAIGIRYLQTYPTEIISSVFTAPMIAINAGSMPPWLAKIAIHTSHFFDQRFHNESSYFFGHGNFKSKPFIGNPLMQSEVRFRLFQQEYARNEGLQLGGVTFHWLKQALKAEKLMLKEVKNTASAMLIIQAENDSIVCNDMQNTFCELLHQQQPSSCPKGKPVVIADGLHELLFEQDSMRSETLDRLITWFKQH